MIFNEDVDNFEIEHKACSFLVSGAVPLKTIIYKLQITYPTTIMVYWYKETKVEA